MTAVTENNAGWVYEDRVDLQDDGLGVIGAETVRVRHGQRLSYHRAPWTEPPVPKNIKVMMEDDDLLGVYKPPGLPVLPGGNYLENTLLRLVCARYPERPVPIHRLGRGTPGLVLFARTPRARGSLSSDLRHGRIKKIYLALVQGLPAGDTWVINKPIGKVPYPKIGYLYAAVEQGRSARTNCRILVRVEEDNASLVEVEIPTGRPHQIRIHLAASGFPLKGDPLYGVGARQQRRPPRPVFFPGRVVITCTPRS